MWTDLSPARGVFLFFVFFYVRSHLHLKNTENKEGRGEWFVEPCPASTPLPRERQHVKKPPPYVGLSDFLRSRFVSRHFSPFKQRVFSLFRQRVFSPSNKECFPPSNKEWFPPSNKEWRVTWQRWASLLLVLRNFLMTHLQCDFHYLCIHRFVCLFVLFCFFPVCNCGKLTYLLPTYPPPYLSTTSPSVRDFPRIPTSVSTTFKRRKRRIQ